LLDAVIMINVSMRFMFLSHIVGRSSHRDNTSRVPASTSDDDSFDDDVDDGTCIALYDFVGELDY